MKISKSLKIAAAALALSVFAVQPAVAVGLTGAGATFPQPLIDACKAGFAADSGHSFTYGGGGSGTGRGNSDKGVGDVNFSDTPHTASTRVSSVIHIPVVAAPIAVMYNLPNKSKTLNLSAETLAGIFAGTITKWNDPKIVADNNRSVTTIIYRKNADGSVKKDAKGTPVVLRTQTLTQKRILPAKPITVFYRSANSGTTNNLTNAFNKLYPSIWTKAANDSFATAFPGDITANPQYFRGATGSGDVANGVKATPYSITYAEVGFAKAPYNLAITKVINAAGNAITPSSDSAMAAAAQATVAADGKVTFAYDTKDADSYPFTATTYALALAGKDNSAAIAKVLSYLSNNCAKDNPAEGFGAYSATNAFAKAFNTQIAKLK